MSPPIALPTRRSRRFGPRRLFGRGLGGAAGAHNPAAIYFDGTNDAARCYEAGSPLAGWRGDKLGFVQSCWVYWTDHTGGAKYLSNATFNDSTTQWSSTHFEADEKLWIFNRENSPVTILCSVAATPTGNNDGEWHHFLFSQWMGSTPGTRRQAYFDDVLFFDTTNGSPIPGTDPDDCVAWYFGRLHATAAFIQPTHISEFFIGTLDSYFDLTVESNRRKFITADGKPVNLGADGSTPLGYQPEIYVTGTDATDWGNVGTLGSWETVYGTFTDSDKLPVGRP